jgi:bifunctional ADP-heptose synthase (sugar kinase/adenylyltransferase)
VTVDTRTKIVDWETALEKARECRTAVVTGYFDPLLASHATRIEELRAGFKRLIVLLSEPAEPLLDARARAELVAALDAIDYVVLPQARASSVEFERIEEVWVFREETADEARFERLVEHVHRRHHTAGPQ